MNTYDLEELKQQRLKLLQALEDGERYRDVYPLLKLVEERIWAAVRGKTS